MRKLLFLFIAVFAFSCSSDDGGNTTNPEVVNPGNPNPENPGPDNPNPTDCTYVGWIILSTQEQIDAFAMKNYCKVDGYFQIGTSSSEGSDITDLSGLSSLKEITGEFLIINNSYLLTLHGLEGLEKVYALRVQTNKSLVNFEGLNNLNAIGNYGNVNCYLHIDGNDALKDFTGLENMKVLSMADIKHNNSLVSLKGLNNVEIIGGVNLYSNNALVSLEGLNNLKNCSSISLSGNESLVSIAALGNLENLEMFFSRGDTSLISLKGLEKIKTMRYISLYADTGLMSLAGLTGLTYLHELRLDRIDNLSSLAGLENIKTMAALNIDRCNSLTTIEQLNVTEFVEKTEGSNAYPGVYINETSINSLDGLESVTSFVGEFNFYNNPHLTNFCAINNIVTPIITFTTEYNAYNPTATDILAGNCNQ